MIARPIVHLHDAQQGWTVAGPQPHPCWKLRVFHVTLSLPHVPHGCATAHFSPLKDAQRGSPEPCRLGHKHVSSLLPSPFLRQSPLCQTCCTGSTSPQQVISLVAVSCRSPLEQLIVASKSRPGRARRGWLGAYR